MGFDFEIKYKPGKENGAADALSRKLQYSALSTIQCPEWEGLEEEVQADDKLRALIQDLLRQLDSHPGFQIKGEKIVLQEENGDSQGFPKNSSNTQGVPRFCNRWPFWIF